MPSLAEFQRDFAAALRTAAASDDLHDARSVGLRIHRNTVIKALVEALVANYPTVGVLMGLEWLSGAACEYVEQHPPRHAVLADYGEDFPGFLRTLDADHAWPYLGGVAELDRAWTISMLAPDAAALQPVNLSGLAPETLGALQLRLHPSAHFGVYRHSAVTIWMASRPPAPPPAELCIDGSEEAALMLRNSGGVTLLPLNAASKAFLKAIMSGCHITEAATAALQAAPGEDISACWSRLLLSGAFAALEIHGD